MTKTALRAVDSEEFLTAQRRGKHNLDELDAARVAKHLLLFRPDDQVLEAMMAKGVWASLALPRPPMSRGFCASIPTACSRWRKSRFDPAAPAAEALSPSCRSTITGCRRWRWTRSIPPIPTSNSGKTGRAARGIYMWAFMPGPAGGGDGLFMEEMAAPQYAGVNLYSRPNTEAGRRFNQALGAMPGAKIGAVEAPHLWVFFRTPARPLYDSYSPDAAPGEIGVTVARSFNDLAA